VVVAAYVLSFFQRFAPAGIAQDLAAAFQTSAASLACWLNRRAGASSSSASASCPCPWAAFAGCWCGIARPASASGIAPSTDRTAIVGSLLSVLRNRATWPPAVVNFGLGGSCFAFGGLWAMRYLLNVHGMSRATPG
jgi:hypothetical protein